MRYLFTRPRRKKALAFGAILTAACIANANSMANASEILSAPGIVPTTKAALTTGFLVPAFQSVPARPEQSDLFYGYDQNAHKVSQPSWFNSRWFDLPALDTKNPDGTDALKNVHSAQPQLSINQFEGVTIRGELTDFLGSFVPPNPIPNYRPVAGYPLTYQFTGEGNLVDCGKAAINMVSQSIGKLGKYHLAAEEVPTRFYEGNGYRVEPGQDATLTTSRAVSISQTVTASLADTFGVSAKPADQAEIRNDTTGTIGSATEGRIEVTQTDALGYHNSSNKVQYYWIGGQADYYVKAGLPYVFWKPDNGGRVQAKYPDGIGPGARGLFNPEFKGALGNWTNAEVDPSARNKQNVSFDWLPKGTCYVGQTLQLAKILYPTKGLALIAQEPFNYDGRTASPPNDQQPEAFIPLNQLPKTTSAAAPSAPVSAAPTPSAATSSTATPSAAPSVVRSTQVPPPSTATNASGSGTPARVIPESSVPGR